MRPFPTLIFALLITCAARAQWTPEVRGQLMGLTPRYQALDTPGLATFWGGYRRWKKFSDNRSKPTAWKSGQFHTGELPIYFSPQDKAAPLLVFMPGIFGETSRGLTPPTIEMLEALGMHLLVVPNVISTEYIRARPRYEGDVVAAQVAVMEQLLDQALAKLGARATEVHVLAESLGTAVGSAWGAHDANTRRRIVSLTLLHPPQDLPVAMKNFDIIIEAHRPWLGRCGAPNMFLRLIEGFMLKDVPSNLTVEEKKCFGAEVLVKSFLRSAVLNHAAYVETEKISTKFRPNSFTDLFSHYRPELWQLLEKRDERLTLSHWVKQMHQLGRPHLRILSSQNDFLNDGLSWDEFRRVTELPAESLIVLPWGGHSGPIGMPEMPGILAQVYRR
jgi:hypothetical protein